MTKLLQILAVCLLTLTSVTALAQETPASGREAGRHFQRGVSLYVEADYRAALVEFRRAYAIWPNAAVLYNIGEAQYQLQDYAAALLTFERYLAESAPGDAHRAEVDNNVEILRARVAHVNVVTVPPGADVTIDDQPVGKTPIDRPVLVSIGHRKIVATVAGRPPVTRYVDVATDDNATVTIQVAEPPTAAPSPPQRLSLPVVPPDAAPASHPGATWRAIGWTTTGILAASAITFAVLADKASNDLSTARATYPVSQGTLQRDASTTSTYSLLADSLAVGAVVVGGVTLLSALTSSPDGPPPRDHAGAARLSVGLASARLDLSF